MIALSGGIWIVGSGALGFDMTHPSDCHVYLVGGPGPGPRVLVDAGCGLATDTILANVSACGVDPEDIGHIFLTHAHADHAGGAADLLGRLPRARVVASAEVARIVASGDGTAAGVDRARRAGTYPSDYVLRPCPVELIAVDGQTFDVAGMTVTAVATPGHSSGHLCYGIDIGGRRVLFSGDHLFVGGRIALQNTWDCSVEDHVRSLYRLRGLWIDALLPGHLGVSMSGAVRHVDLAIAALDAGRLPPNII